MTAAYRFKGLGWLLTSVIVALACYMVSLQVAAERRKLADAATQVRLARRDIRMLETEFDARANMVQLERWNGESFRYAAPVAQQYLADTATLAHLDLNQPPPGAKPGAAHVELAHLVIPSAPLPVAQPAQAQPTAPAPPRIEQAAYVTPVGPAKAKPAEPKLATLRSALVAALPDAPKHNAAHAATAPRMASLDRKLLSDATLGDLRSLASAESGR